MAEDNEIGVRAVYEDEGLQEGIDNYNKQMEESAEQTETSTEEMTSAFTTLNVVGAAAFAALAFAVGLAVDEILDSIDAAAESEEIMTRLDFMVNKLGDTSGVTSEQVNNLATEISKVAPFDDEVVAEAITMGLKFDGITKDNIEPMTKAAVDLASLTGKSLPTAMRSLAMAMSDPERAMRVLRDAGITLTDAEKEQLATWKDSGELATAQTWILERLQGKVGGLGEVMGDTFKGKMAIMETALGNLEEALGGPILESIGKFIDAITEVVNRPEITESLIQIGTAIGSLLGVVAKALPYILKAFTDVFGFLVKHEGIIIGVLAGITVAMVAFGIAAVQALIPVMTAVMATVTGVMATIAPILLVIAAIALLYEAWTNNWFGIRDTLTAVWETISTTFQGVIEWFQTKIPQAIETVRSWWVDQLLPAFQTVGDWIQNTLFPILETIATIIFGPVILAITALKAYWTEFLYPALQLIWGFISENIIPLFEALAELLTAVVGAAIRIVAGIIISIFQPIIEDIKEKVDIFKTALTAVADFLSKAFKKALEDVHTFISTLLKPVFEKTSEVLENDVKPAFQTVSDFINNTVIKVLKDLYNWINDNVMQALQDLANFLLGALADAFNFLATPIQNLIGWLGDLTSGLNNVAVPEDLRHNSPSPFELALMGANKELSTMARTSLPRVTAELSVLGKANFSTPVLSGSGSSSVSNSNTSVNLGGIHINVSSEGRDSYEIGQAAQSGILKALRATGLA